MSQETLLYKLDLPVPSDKIKDFMYEIYTDHFVTDTGALPYRKGNDSRADHSLNVSGMYEHLELSRQVREEYSQYFPGIEISGYFAIFRGDYETTGIAKRYQAHVDFTRCVTMNYYFEVGGDDVRTNFYDFFDDSESRDSPIILGDNEPPLLGYQVFKKNQWYMFNGGSQAHSVENIMGVRLYLGIMFLSDDSDKIKLYNDPAISDKYIMNPSKVLERSPYKHSDIVSKLCQSGVELTKLNLIN